jgi:hypothetical protein
VATEILTDSEMETLRRGATGAGLLVAVSDRGFFDTFKEAGAMGKHLAEARKNSDSPLVRRLAETRGIGFGLTASPDEIESGTLEALRTRAGFCKARRLKSSTHIDISCSTLPARCHQPQGAETR